MPEKNDIIHFRVSPKDKEEINLLAEYLSTSLPVVCSKCETRFTEDEMERFAGKCPYCGGELKQSKVSTSQIIRYAWKFLKTIELYGYNMYDVFYEMIRDRDFRNRMSKISVDLSDNGNGNALILLQKILYVARDDLREYPFSRLTKLLYVRAVKDEEIGVIKNVRKY